MKKNGNKTILILSASKLKTKFPGIDKHFENINSIDERMFFNEYKWIAQDLAKLGIDINAYIIDKLIERHNQKIKNGQLKLFF